MNISKGYWHTRNGELVWVEDIEGNNAYGVHGLYNSKKQMTKCTALIWEDGKDKIGGMEWDLVRKLGRNEPLENVH